MKIGPVMFVHMRPQMFVAPLVSRLILGVTILHCVLDEDEGGIYQLRDVTTED